MGRPKKFNPKLDLRGSQVRCWTCNTFKDRDGFLKHKKTASGVNHKCKACYKAENDRRKQTEPGFREKRVHWGRRQTLSQYGLTLEAYEEMLAGQHGVCAICKLPETEIDNRKGVGKTEFGYKRLSVDHCHITNEVRGLLCTKCNTGIGMFKDSTALLVAALDYLGRTEWH